MPDQYDVKPVNGSLLVTKKSQTTLATKHKGKTWTQLSTPDKLDLIALVLGLINEEGDIICLKTNIV